MRGLLSLFAPKQSADPMIVKLDTSVFSYGQAVSGMQPDLIQNSLEWLFLSLLKAGYMGRAHLFWLDSKHDSAVLKKQRHLANRNQLVFLYRCGDRTPPAPNGYYWRLMPEHRAMRIYQLEVRLED